MGGHEGIERKLVTLHCAILREEGRREEGRGGGGGGGGVTLCCITLCGRNDTCPGERKL